MSVVSFRGERTVVVSPHHPSKDEEGHQIALAHLATKLKTTPEFMYDGGIIKVRGVGKDIRKGKQYWGGFGVAVLISESFNGASLSQAIGEDVVVYDQLEQKLFHNGEEKSTALVLPLRPSV